MKKFQSNKRNPNPPWPSEVPVVMVPPGGSAESVGMSGQRVYNMPAQTAENIAENARNSSDESYPIMGMMQRPNDRILQNRAEMQGGMMPQSGTEMMRPGADCGNTYINGYLCGHTGRYVRLEFMFGEQNHVEKTGMLREVGKNYIVMQEMGTDTMIVCPLDKIKFINIYNVDNNRSQL